LKALSRLLLSGGGPTRLAILPTNTTKQRDSLFCLPYHKQMGIKLIPWVWLEKASTIQGNLGSALHQSPCGDTPRIFLTALQQGFTEAQIRSPKPGCVGITAILKMISPGRAN